MKQHNTRKSYLNRDARATASVTTTPDSTLPSYSISVFGLALTNCTSSGIVSSREYDALGRTIASTDGRGNTTTLSYDAQGRVSWSEDALGARTTYAYDALGRQIAVTNALGQATYTAYNAENQVVSTWGATYPVGYAYDAFGRMTAMNTFRDEAMQNGDTTTWLYDEPTGLLTNKVYADGKGPLYSYTPDGKLATRTWARGSVASYAYDASGQITGVDYSDSTPDVSFTYDRLGSQLSAIAAGVSTNLYAYSRYGQLTNETVLTGRGSVPVLSRATDALGRAAGFSVAGVGDPGQPYSVAYGYDAYGRFQSVESAQSADTFTYTYLSGSDLVSGMTASTGHAWTRSYESQRNLIAAVENTYDSTVISRFDYVNDKIGRRTAISRSGTAFDAPVQDAYGYNVRSEVTSARRSLVNDANQEVRGFSHDYAYDPIGNRTSATEYDHEENALVSSYTANALNQYSQRTVPGYAGVRGSATNTATVTVNGNAAWRLDDYFYGGDDADNAASAVMKELDITAVVNPPGTNEADLVESVTGKVFVAKSPEAFTHDDDGNLLSDGRFIYTWDGENRLIAVETRSDLPASVPRVKVTYQYDPRFRRIGKEVSRRGAEAQSWNLEESRTFLYDGWNMIREIQQSNIPSFHSSTNSYIWGLDLSGSLQGAGGVGGLLAVVKDSATFHPAFDGNGNVTEYTDVSGSISAHYEYSPFGETAIQTGSLADTFGFRFSTKYWENEAKLYYYGYRFYAPGVGRWLNRDPIGEKGSLNLHAFCGNDSVSKWDLLGMATRMGMPLFYEYNGFIYYAFQAIKTKGGCCEINVVQLFGKVGDKASDLKLDDTLEFDPDGKGEGKKLYYLNEYEMYDVTMLSEKKLQQSGFDPMISYVFADKPGSMNGNWDVGTLIGYLIPVEICWYNEGKTIEFLGIGKYSKRGREYSYGLMSTPYEKQQIDEFLQKHFGPESGFVKAVWK